MDQLPHPSKEISIVETEALDLNLGFSLKLRELGLWKTEHLFSSLQTSGILEPILVAYEQDSSGPALLIDGFKRLMWARDRGISHLSAMDTSLSPRELLLFLLQKHCNALTSCALIALFLDFVAERGFDSHLILNEIMPALGLQGHAKLLEKYRRVATLPVKVLTLCHKKDFSLKRCINLTHQPRQLLERLIELEGKLSLSASLFQELCDAISDILKREGLSVEEFFQRKEIIEILEAGQDRATTTRLFRSYIRKLRNPLLTSYQRELQKIHKTYFSSAPFHVKWDETLENRRIEISSSVTDIEELRNLSKAISSEKTQKGVKELLSRF